MKIAMIRDSPMHVKFSMIAMATELQTPVNPVKTATDQEFRTVASWMAMTATPMDSLMSVIQIVTKTVFPTIVKPIAIKTVNPTIAKILMTVMPMEFLTNARIGKIAMKTECLTFAKVMKIAMAMGFPTVASPFTIAMKMAFPTSANS